MVDAQSARPQPLGADLLYQQILHVHDEAGRRDDVEEPRAVLQWLAADLLRLRRAEVARILISRSTVNWRPLAASGSSSGL